MVPFPLSSFMRTLIIFILKEIKGKGTGPELLRSSMTKDALSLDLPNFSWAPIQGALMLAYVLEKLYCICQFLPTNPSRTLQKNHASISDNCWQSHCWRDCKPLLRWHQNTVQPTHILLAVTCHNSSLQFVPLAHTDQWQIKKHTFAGLHIWLCSMNPAIQ